MDTKNRQSIKVLDAMRYIIKKFVCYPVEKERGMRVEKETKHMLKTEKPLLSRGSNIGFKCCGLEGGGM